MLAISCGSFGPFLAGGDREAARRAFRPLPMAIISGASPLPMAPSSNQIVRPTAKPEPFKA